MTATADPAKVRDRLRELTGLMLSRQKAFLISQYEFYATAALGRVG